MWFVIDVVAMWFVINVVGYIIVDIYQYGQCSHYADFFQRIGDLLEQGQIIFGNIVNKALENSTNL